MPQASNVPTQVSTSSQMPSWSRSWAQAPPHTPKASSWLPLQSQSPAGMFAHPPYVDIARTVADATGVQRTHAFVHVVADAVIVDVKEARTIAVTNSVQRTSKVSKSSQMPSPSASAVQAPPHAQGVELVAPQSQSPAAMFAHHTRRSRRDRCRCRRRPTCLRTRPRRRRCHLGRGLGRRLLHTPRRQAGCH